ncbi:MAG: hypothetical protein HZB35_11060 [Nitrospirae bacterium]|nr:hypothetical protein [Nitrospirota bacterium]
MNVFEAEQMQPGDLLVWDQELTHDVPPVTESDPNDPRAGFWRILMPIHPIVARQELWQPGMVNLPERTAVPAPTSVEGYGARQPIRG